MMKNHFKKRLVIVCCTAFCIALTGCAQNGASVSSGPAAPSGSQAEAAEPTGASDSSAAEAAPKPPPQPEAPESGEYPIGTWLELSANEGDTIYYALGGEEIQSLDESDYLPYAGPVLLPPYESQLLSYCKDESGQRGPTIERAYRVYDDDTAQQDYEDDKALKEAFEPVLAALVNLKEEQRVFSAPEQMSREQTCIFALQNAPIENSIIQVVTTAEYVLHEDALNEWLKTYFDGRAALPTTEEWIAMQANPSDRITAADGKVYQADDGYLSWNREQITYIPHVLSLTRGEDQLEMTVCFDTSQAYSGTLVGYEEPQYIGLPGDSRASALVEGSFRKDSNSGSSQIDYDALARMNFGVYQEAYRYSFSKRSDGGWMPESCTKIPVDTSCYAPQVHPSMPSGAVIAPEGWMRLTLDGNWMGEIFYSYDGETYQKYLGVLMDLPNNDFTLFTYAQQNGNQGRVSKYTYKTTELDPRVLEQISAYSSSFFSPEKGLKDFHGDLSRAMSDDDFMATMMNSCRINSDSDAVSKLEDDMYAPYLISTDVTEAYIRRITCGRRKPVHAGEEKQWFDAEHDAYLCPSFDVPAFIYYYDFEKTESGFRIKALMDHDYSGPNFTAGSETQTLSYGSTDWTCDKNTEITSLGLAVPVFPPSLSDPVVWQEMDRCLRAIVVKNAERFVSPTKEGTAYPGWRELTFTEDSSGGLYLSACKTLR